MPRRCSRLAAVSGALICALLSSLALAAPWSIKRDPKADAERLLKLMERSPETGLGVEAMVRAVGIRRAVQMARRRLREAPSWRTQLSLGRLLLRARRRGAALVQLRKALVGAAKETQPALGWAAQALVEANARAQAARLIARFRKRYADDAGAAQLAVRLALARRDLQVAVSEQQRLARLRPKAQQVQRVLARLLVRAGRFDDAATQLGAMLKLKTLSSETRCELLRDLAGLEEKLERFKDAVTHYRAALKLADGGSWIDRDLRKRLLDSYRTRRDRAGLIKEAERMLKADPKAALALEVLGDENLRVGRVPEAITYFERYLKVSPGDHTVRARLMFLLMRRGMRARATVHAGELHKRRPSVPRHLLEWAALLSSGGKRAEARAALRKGITLYAKDSDGLQLVAGALSDLGDNDGAKLAFAALVKLAASDRSSQGAIGRYLWQRGQRGPALDAWTAMLGKKPTALAYHTWVELVLSVRAQSFPSLRARVAAELRRGLQHYPKHDGLRTLARQLAKHRARR
ncbi:MAG: tetratricopeptide repeat protein [Myxococcales bacterium]|nr:tetratricopeptide repeat protein [Myxococcales bacterium]